jgi:hypothetical protein
MIIGPGGLEDRRDRMSAIRTMITHPRKSTSSSRTENSGRGRPPGFPRASAVPSIIRRESNTRCGRSTHRCLPSGHCWRQLRHSSRRRNDIHQREPR